ncbi:MAG: amidohydrolase family protein [Xanthomonadales bacterium]|jgi:imidazolonepropionase-like amidohydrolase|nr:amidohydrolase family protein [Xanthomonadales bacterium]
MQRVAKAVSLLMIFGSVTAPDASAADTWLTAERLLDVRSGRWIEQPGVLIREGRIISVAAKAANSAAPADAQVIALDGMSVIPGLIDMHVHLDFDPRYSGYSGLQFNDRFWSVVMVPQAQRTLQAGFTTVRNVGSRDWNDVGLREAIDAGQLVGPRVVSAAYAFGATGGHCDETFYPPSMAMRSPYNADSPEEGRKRVREIRKYGAQVIKICATGGVFSRNTEPGQQQLHREEMAAIVDEAHMWGLKVAAHAHGTYGIRDAIAAGVDTIEHASLIDAKGIELALQHGTWLSMDIYNTDYTQSEGKKNGVLEDNLRKDREIADLQRENFRKAHKAGVRMVYGTDAGIFPHGENAKQLAVMVRYGMTPLEAIQSATVNASEALASADVGVLETGRWADLVAVVGDPTQDVTLLEQIPVVIKGGEVVKDAR